MSKDYDSKDFGEDARDYTCNGKCFKCGNCCIPWCPITQKEYETIKEYIKKNNIKAQSLKEGNNYYMDCCFHDRKNHKCNIYEVRPEVCKNFICSSSFEKVDKDRRYYDKRAEINGESGRLVPFDLLFYDNPITLLLLITNKFKAKNIDEIKHWLLRLGNPDIVEAIDKKQIVIELGEDD